jgi:HEAT repeat protein
MPVTMQQVLAELDSEEPRYDRLRALGPEALPHLDMLVEADDGLRAAKAAYAASLIGGGGSIDLLRKAAQHQDPQVRVAAASGLKNAADEAPSEVLEGLLGDEDAGVRKMAVGTAGTLNRADLRDKVAAIAADDPEEFLRATASDVARDMP